MFRVIGFVGLLALSASAAHSEEDRRAYSHAQARLTEQLNAVIARGVALDAAAPPAKADVPAGEHALAKADRAAR